MGEEKIGVKETKELVNGLMVLSKIIALKIKDGFQPITDLVGIVTAAASDKEVVEAFKGVTAVKEEIEDLSLQEGIELGVMAALRVPEIMEAFKKSE